MEDKKGKTKFVMAKEGVRCRSCQTMSFLGGNSSDHRRPQSFQETCNNGASCWP